MSKILYGNFYKSEVSKSYVATREGINNVPNQNKLSNAKLLAEKCLQPIRDHYGVAFTPNSWYRSPPLEMIICHKSFERWAIKNRYMIHDSAELHQAKIVYLELKSHPTGGAADIELPGISNDDLFTWCGANLEFDQLIREFAKPGDPESGWVHISFSREKNRNEIFNI